MLGLFSYNNLFVCYICAIIAVNMQFESDGDSAAYTELISVL